MSAITYKYSEQFQRQIVALCLRDVTFLRNYEDVIDPTYFDYDYLSSIFRVGADMIFKHNQIPSHATLVEEVKEFCDTYGIKNQEKLEVIDQISSIYKLDLFDADAIKERVIRFGKHQALKSALIHATDLIENESQYDKVNEIINKAMIVGNNTNNLGLSLVGNFSQLPSLVNGSYDSRNKVPTNFSRLDNALQGGGPGFGELWAVLGRAGIGKSQMLVHMGAVALKRGFSVIHITIGDLDEIDVGVRYAARLTLTNIDDVINCTESYKKRAEIQDSYIEQYLRIKYYSAHSVTPRGVRNYLSKLITVNGIKPNVVIIDYPDEFRPYSDNDYQNMGRIYSELKQMADDFNCLIWVASQVRRLQDAGEDDTKYLTMDSIADSWRKAAKADGVISFNQTVAENQNNRARLFVDKVRRGERGFAIPVAVDFAKSYIKELSAEDARMG